jgi:hypothetical protein
MNETLQRILDELPAEEPRSRLEPFRELILQLRRRGCTYRRIVHILADKCAVEVVPSTLHEFVQRRSRKPWASDVRDETQPAAPPKEPPARVPSAARRSSPDAERARQRIRAVKAEPIATDGRRKTFQYDPEEPLFLDPTKEK